MSDDKMITKINGLLRKAESTTPEEAELLFEKAAELMAKYQIDEAMLRAAAPKAGRGGVEREEFVSVSIWRFPIAEMKFRVAQAMGLKVIKLWGSWREVSGKLYKQTEIYEMFGYKEDLDNFKIIITSLEIQMMRAENTWWKEFGNLYAHETKSGQHQARRGFMFGFASGAAEKYRQIHAKATQTATQQHGESVALVLRDKSLEIQDAFRSAYPSTRSVSDRKGRGDGFAQGKGREAGRNADVGGTRLGGSRKQLS